MRCNVDLLKIIQIGLTLSDEDGNYPQDVSTWQFNFHFSVKCVFFPPPPNRCSPSEEEAKEGGRGLFVDMRLLIAGPSQRRHVRAGIRRALAKVWHRFSTTRGNWDIAKRFRRAHDHVWPGAYGRHEVDFLP